MRSIFPTLESSLECGIIIELCLKILVLRRNTQILEKKNWMGVRQVNELTITIVGSLLIQLKHQSST